MSNNNKTIFISIASYRDTELAPTVQDCLAKAKNPKRLRFGIIQQFAEEDKDIDDLVEYQKDKRFNIVAIDHKKAGGVCKIRKQIQEMYDGEDYILQLDSHHRFIQDWDQVCIQELEALKKKHEKPILTAYLPSYDPDDEKSWVQSPWEMRFDRYLPQGPAMPKPETIDDHKQLKAPVPAMFLSGHFIFADGHFYVDVPYDPELYFHGEEISLSIRAFTHGYDMFHPHKLIAWHHYTRAGSKRHWDDSGEWDRLNAKSFAKYRKLVKIDKTKEKLTCGLGEERTLNQYIRYSGIDVTNKMVHKNNLARQRPPLKYKRGEYKTGFCKKIRYCIDLFKGSVPEDDYDVWVTAFKDSEGNEIFRKDYPADAIKRLQNSIDTDDNFYRIWSEFEAATEPVEWLVWPHSKSKDWCDRIVNKIQT